MASFDMNDPKLRQILLESIIAGIMTRPITFQCVIRGGAILPLISAKIIHHDFPKQPPRRPLFREVIAFPFRDKTSILWPYKA